MRNRLQSLDEAFWPCRCSPESVALAMLHALQQADIQQCLKFFLWPGARTQAQLPFLQRSFQEGTRRMLLRHKQASALAPRLQSKRALVACLLI